VSEPGVVGAAGKVNILLVDDRPSNLLSLRAVLDRPDYNLVLAESGAQALALVLKYEFAVILLDVAMPQMDGFEVATTIKQRERFRFTPIIFVTASVQHIEWIFRAYSVGAVDFLHKPLDPHAVRAKVAVFVEMYRQRVLLRRQGERMREMEHRERQLEVAKLKWENEQRYRNLAEAIPHIVWTAGPQGEVHYLNRRWAELTGLPNDASLGSGWRVAIHPDDVERLEALWKQALQDGREFETECRVRQRDGGFRWYLFHALPDRAENQAVSRWLGTFTDVDEQRRAGDAARLAVRVREEFVSVTSHELRTPLTSLKLLLETLERSLREPLDPSKGPQILNRLSAALRQTERLSKLIDALLDVSRMAAGRLQLEPEPFDLSELAHEVVDRFHDEAARAGCALTLTAPGPLPGRWDKLRLDQVLTNLLTNAFKYGRGKPVAVSVEDGGEELCISVKDHGIGIAPEALSRIFARFERAVSPRNYGGLGLGLYIANEIMLAHGGTLAVESVLGEGSTFTMHLPRQVHDSPSVGPQLPHPPASS